MASVDVRKVDEGARSARELVRDLRGQRSRSETREGGFEVENSASHVVPSTGYDDEGELDALLASWRQDLGVGSAAQLVQPRHLLA